jgi:hypothetical protein
MPLFTLRKELKGHLNLKQAASGVIRLQNGTYPYQVLHRPAQ